MWSPRVRATRGPLAGAALAPPPPGDSEWHTLEDSTLEDCPEGDAEASYYDVASLENLGLGKNSLKRLGKCYAFVELESLQTLFRGAFGCILHKKADMQAAKQSSDSMERWMASLRGEDASDVASTAAGDDDGASDIASVAASRQQPRRSRPPKG